VRHACPLHDELTEFDGLGRLCAGLAPQLAHVDLSSELHHLHREERRPDRPLERCAKELSLLSRPVQSEVRSRFVQRSEEREPQDVVEVEMGEQRVQLERPGMTAVRAKRLPESA
jgi:hypothetical protein